MWDVICQNRTVACNLAVMTTNWVVVVFNYYMVNIGVANLGHNVYLVSIACGVSCILACLF